MNSCAMDSKWKRKQENSRLRVPSRNPAPHLDSPPYLATNTTKLIESQITTLMNNLVALEEDYQKTVKQTIIPGFETTVPGKDANKSKDARKKGPNTDIGGKRLFSTSRCESNVGIFKGFSAVSGTRSLSSASDGQEKGAQPVTVEGGKESIKGLIDNLSLDKILLENKARSHFQLKPSNTFSNHSTKDDAKRADSVPSDSLNTDTDNGQDLDLLSIDDVDRVFQTNVLEGMRKNHQSLQPDYDTATERQLLYERDGLNYQAIVGMKRLVNGPARFEPI